MAANKPLSWKNPDIAIAACIVGIFFILLVPIPSVLLDFFLALSLSFSVIILLVSLYISNPLEFDSFPSLLLLSTLFRLVLNIATTKSILMNGGTENHGVSELVQAFGNVVVGGNFFVGFVVFIIIMVINFIVITKGSGRIAEVAARFTLDAMPGKQMSIDAELNAGHIAADEAKIKRKAIEAEADFYGAMDGASKFVRGESIAAILITGVNILFGLLVGMIQQGMDPLSAAKTFTLLSVGDGLISALPALMISTASGIIVTRASSEGHLGETIGNQIQAHPRAFYGTSVLIILLALIPGFPKIPFFVLGGVLFMIGRNFQKQNLIKENLLESDKNQLEQDQEDPDSWMKVDSLTIEVGHALIHLIDPQEDGEMINRVQSIRKQFAQDMGVVVPQVQLKDNLTLDPHRYSILIKGTPVASGYLMTDCFLAMDPGSIEDPIEGEVTQDPVYGLAALWIAKRDKEEAILRGYTVVNPATIIATHITKILKENMAELLTRQDIQVVVDRLKVTHPKVIEEVLHPERLTLGDVLKVMQNLLREEVSVRDSLSLFECLADHCKMVKNPDVLSEQCRQAIGRSIVQKYLTDDGVLNVMAFDRVIEDVLAGALVTSENGSTFFKIEANVAKSVLEKVAETSEKCASLAAPPVLLVSARLRQALQKLIRRYIPTLSILAYDEVPLNAKIKTLELIH